MGKNENIPIIIGKHISILHRQEQKYIAGKMKKYGLSAPSHSFLLYLKNNEGITQRELCSILALDIALASRTMNALEEQGYIIRQRDEKKANAYKLFLTDKARELVEVLTAEYKEWWEKIFSGMDREQLDSLTGQLEKLASNAVQEWEAQAKSER